MTTTPDEAEQLRLSPLDTLGFDFYERRRKAGVPHTLALVEALNNMRLRENGMTWEAYYRLGAQTKR